ncbi:DUF4296 domain-containing protein [Yeosuana aromativorans]|nr:DUF4296 domain-containing protein [Yeosuana aromativorans]
MISGVLMVSCYTFNKPDKPKHLLSKKEMVNIIIDLKLMASSNGSNRKILEDNGVYSDDYIYKKYHIDSLTFASNNAYYSFYINDYEAIYNKVKDSLEALNEFYKELEKEELKEKRKQDSISKIRKKDSINALMVKDSVALRATQDSIRKLKLNRPEPRLIEPVSDKAAQSR